MNWNLKTHLFKRRKYIFLPSICFNCFAGTWQNRRLHLAEALAWMGCDFIFIPVIRLIQSGGWALLHVILITQDRCKLTFKTHWGLKTRSIVARWYIQTHFLEGRYIHIASDVTDVYPWGFCSIALDICTCRCWLRSWLMADHANATIYCLNLS